MPSRDNVICASCELSHINSTCKTTHTYIMENKVTAWPSAKMIKNKYIFNTPYACISLFDFASQHLFTLFLWFECRHCLIRDYFMDS